MPYGWVGRLLYVDLTAGTFEERDTLAYADTTLGGRALATRLAWEEIPPGIDAYDPDNRLILTTGPLCGTLAPTSGRAVMAALSPRTYPRCWYTHSTLGGWFGSELKYAGYDGLILRGRAPSPVYLAIRDGRPSLREADDLWGLGSRETQHLLRERLGLGAQVLAIGPAGERGVRLATVQHAEENAAGHSGFGAVWGSKRLKAIVVRGEGAVAVAHPQELLAEVRRQGSFHLAPSTAAARRHPQDIPRPVCSQACAYNCLVGGYNRTPDGRRSPYHCIGSVWSRKNGLAATAYQGGGVTVPPAPNFDYDTEVALHERCNDLGLDLWFRLVMHPWFVRCVQLGVHHIRGHPLAPEDPAWFRAFMEDLAYRRGLGALFADGLRRAVDALQDELPEELVHLGRELTFDFGFPAHREGRFWDEEPLPFWVISAMLHAGAGRDPTIGTHQSALLLADLLLRDRERALAQFEALSRRVWGDARALAPSYEAKAPMAVWAENQHMLIDSFPLCDFAFPQLVYPFESEESWRQADDILGDLEAPRRLLYAVTGLSLDDAALSAIAERAIHLERALLVRAGRDRSLDESLAPHFALPCRADGTAIDAAGFAKLLDEYYVARGWDLVRGWPLPERLRALGLEQVAAELAQRAKNR